MRKASLDHLLMDLTTSKGIPCKRYSNVTPMRIPCPFNDSIPSLVATVLIRLRNLARVSGQRPCGCLHEKRALSFGG